MSAGDQTQATIDRVLAIVRRNFKLLLLCVILVPAAALVYSLLQEREYTASASLLFRDPGLDEKLFGASLFSQDDDPQRAAATNLKLVGLREVADRTAQALPGSGLDGEDIAGMVSVAPEGESDLIAVEAVDTSPAFAARLANTFAREYIEFRRDADRAKISEAQALVENELADLDPDEQLGPGGEQLEKRARELEILASLQTGNAELVQPAEPPTEASSPKPVRNVALGIVLGLLLGAALTVLREQLDRRLKDAGEAASVFGLPVLATIPESRAISGMGAGDNGAPAGAEGDAFRMLRANLRYFNVDREVKSILVTSAAPQDGKTTVSWNLAVAEMRAGKRVLYLEADLRRPSLGKALGATTTEGLSLVLAGVVGVESAIQSIHGIDVLLAGPLPPNPAELIESGRMRDLIRWGEQNYDRVIIDTPPAAIVADAVPLAIEVTGVVIVVRIMRSRRDAAEHLREQLTNIGAPILGVVVNGTAARTVTYYRSPGMERLYQETPPAVDSPAPPRVRPPKQAAGAQRERSKRPS